MSARVHGSLPRLPAVLETKVDRHARDMGRMIAADDLLLLAITELPAESPARRAVEAEGLTTERILRHVRTAGDEGSPPPQWMTYPPASYRVKGRAEGIAAALGDGTITPEHVLMALLWDPLSLSSQILWKLGIGRERILEHLRRTGVPVVSAPLPAQYELDWGQRVWIERDQLQTVLSHLGRRIGTSAVWGWNYDGDRAWVDAESHIDVRSLIDEALAG